MRFSAPLRLCAIFSGKERPPLKGVLQGLGIGVFEVAPHGQPQRDAREAQTACLVAAGEVERRRFAVHARVHRQDDLLDPFPLDAGVERGDGQVLRRDPPERAEAAPQHVIPSPEPACGFERDGVHEVFHHAQEPVVAFRVPADRAGIVFRDLEAVGTGVQALAGLEEGVGQFLRLFGRRLDQVKRQPLGAFPSDGGEFQEVRHQRFERRRHRSGHEPEGPFRVLRVSSSGLENTHTPYQPGGGGVKANRREVFPFSWTAKTLSKKMLPKIPPRHQDTKKIPIPALVPWLFSV